MRVTRSLQTAAAVLLVLSSSSALAQDRVSDDDGPTRWRVALGPQLVPSYPGASSLSLRPMIDVARASGDAPFEFEAADESFGFPIFRNGGFAIGPSLNIEGSRTKEDVGADLPKVGTTVELGGFVNYALSPAVRFRVEARKGLGGHKGWVGTAGADYVARTGDDLLFSIGPRVTLADSRYERAYFGVAPLDAERSGLPAYRPEGGVEAVGGVAGLIVQLSPKWGIYTYAKYDRLVGDAADSPVVRRFGSRNQFSFGAALTYSFTAGS